jgi:hypothetical protein
MRSSLLAAGLLGLAGTAPLTAPAGLRFSVTFPAARSSAALDGRLLILISADSSAEPRFQVSDNVTTAQVYGMDVDGWKPGAIAVVAVTGVFGYPIRNVSDLPRGRYRVQALLNRYETFRRSDGHTVKLPPDKGEGQQWSRKPGNLYSVPKTIEVSGVGNRESGVGNRESGVVKLVLDQEIPPIEPAKDTKYVKHLTITSERLTKFWGRPVTLTAHVLLPQGFESHPNARYPLVINHGHFPADFDGFRPEPPDTTIPCEYSARFHLACYNRIQQQYAHQFYEEWTGPDFPRVLLVEIAHPTPFYDDSYAVNSANNGPYGDAIMYELIPEIEKRFRGIGQGYARFTYGGSTGGWEAMAVQMFYPEEFNGAWIACPDPIDFRAYTVIDLYADSNAYYTEGSFKRTPRPGLRNYLGQTSTTIEQMNQRELALGTKTRSGDQWDIWEAVYSPVGPDGYPARIWDKETGKIDPKVAGYWKEHFDLSWILRRDWKTLGPKVRGKLKIYVGEADNYHLNNAVYLVEEFLKTADPPAEAEVDYEPRAEHCWNGDHTRPNATSRLRYHQMFIPRILGEIRKRHPSGVDTVSWRY